MTNEYEHIHTLGTISVVRQDRTERSINVEKQTRSTVNVVQEYQYSDERPVANDFRLSRFGLDEPVRPGKRNETHD